MNSFLERMREELVRRNYAQSTMRSYLRIVRDFQVYCGKRLNRLGPDDLRSYHAYLLEERKLAVRTVVQHVAGRVVIAEQFLLAQTAQSCPIDRLTASANDVFARRGVVPIAQLAERYETSERQFLSQFRRKLGLWPKLFCAGGELPDGAPGRIFQSIGDSRPPASLD